MLRSTVRAALFFAIFGFAVGTEKAHAAIYNTFTALNQADEFALDATFSSVGLFVGTSVNGIETIAGSGVLIDPWWVLTAGHVPFSSPGQYYQSMEFNLAPNVGQNLDQFVGAAAFFTFPGYSSNIPAGQGDDIGLVRLSEPIFSVTPAQRFYGQDQEGTVMTMAGYGNPGVWPNPGTFDGIRRAGQNVGDTFGRVFGVTTVEEQYWVSNLNSVTPYALEWNASKNDSGGGWFAEIAGNTYLTGITSGGLLDHSATFATRVSLYNPWIDETMAANSIPEPSSILLMGISFLGFGVSRFRKSS